VPNTPSTTNAASARCFCSEIGTRWLQNLTVETLEWGHGFKQMLLLEPLAQNHLIVGRSLERFAISEIQRVTVPKLKGFLGKAIRSLPSSRPTVQNRRGVPWLSLLTFL
jgi:hypothetical protein